MSRKTIPEDGTSVDMNDKRIAAGFGGFHNQNPNSAARVAKGKGYKDASVKCVIPSRGKIHARVVERWFGLMTPMNQRFFRMFMIGMPVDQAYNVAIETIMGHPELKNWPYILTLEDDNIPPLDGILRLIDDMDEADVVGGLYWLKGENGQPMIYGDPNVMPLNFWPQVPRENQLQACNGLGMGFTMFKTSIFSDERIPKPWFKTEQSMENGGVRMYTQDLYFFEKIHGLGYKVACDTRIKVGHYDADNDFIW